MTPDATVTVIVPSLDEAQNLEEVLPKIPAQYELIIVEGARFHRTSELVRSLRPDARVIEQTRYGKGNAVACGFAAATGDIIVMFDADGSADPDEIPRFVGAITDGAMFAKGTRSRGGGSDDITHLRNAGNVGLTLLTNLMFGVRYTDLCYGYNALHRDLLPLLDLPDPEPAGGAPQWGDGFEIETLINVRAALAGVPITEVPSHERSRIHGVSNLNAWRDGKRVLATLVRERRTARERLIAVDPMHQSDTPLSVRGQFPLS
ncbi:glycosyltransferase [Leucobacter sp. 7(1)]|uniref:glycosyltransferase family 2 protein n=1 Tax=Leucobacter sp. 7(1) TaxID=1255613 RepID=UPI00097F1389|nr:glycosyltransferase family 2 protein [Leucobacter sp. 7(1)]SJN10487.1 glycosyltransferase [Leucobacter sp. 7(1)]